jgi:A/G-specific adenine glycosylase
MTSEFTTTILRWFATNRRDLPWRETQDPYAIWLSEIILQQTRIQQGIAYWERFMHRWPTVADLAAATEDEVLREWQGLGYYSRARNLHTAAQQIVANGSFPTTIESLRKLKGVGDYTAAAIASIAFGLPSAVVDGNVYRVLARYFGIDTPINSTEGKKTFTALAQELLPPTQASAFNQAMMDFGAIQCTPQSPLCASCPLIETCDAYHTQRTQQLPVKLHKLRIHERHFSYYYIRLIENGVNLTAIRRRPSGDIWQGLWEPLMTEDSTTFPPIEGTITLLRRDVKHILTHQVIYADFYLVETTHRPDLPSAFQWIAESDLNRYALPRLVEHLIDSLP